MCSSSILSTCPNHLSTHWSTLPDICPSTCALIISSLPHFLLCSTMSIHTLLRHPTSKTSNSSSLLLSSIVVIFIDISNDIDNMIMINSNNKWKQTLSWWPWYSMNLLYSAFMDLVYSSKVSRASSQRTTFLNWLAIPCSESLILLTWKEHLINFGGNMESCNALDSWQCL